MALPKGDQYNEAVQNPNLSFADQDLKSARVETNFLELPKPYSGGFTVTFKLQGPAKNWAVRCMIREVPELQTRYQAISNYFSARSSRFFVDASYLSHGIKVNGIFYPVIKMKWMDGDPLNIYLSKNYNNKEKVEAILNDFKKLIRELEVMGIAHGDLQHGNIIVKNEQLYLIDYDGMYLPALNGMKSNEVGHAAFQHPQRSAQHFNVTIDRFSSIVIYLCLKALIYRPALWNKYHNSDNLLIKSLDIADLSNSALINDLYTIPEMKAIVEGFIGVCHLNFDSVPSLTDFINGNFSYDRTNTTKIQVKDSLYPVLDGKMKGTILEHYGEKIEVIGMITDYYAGETYSKKPYYFLNIGRFPGQTFTITIWSEGIEALKSAGKTPSLLVGKWVSVIGVITSYRDRPQTIAELPSQIQILSGEQEAMQRLRLRTQSNTSNIKAATPSKKTTDPEVDIFGKLYKDRPVTQPKPIPQPQQAQPRPVQTTPTKTSYSGSYNSTSSPPSPKQSKAPADDPGCGIAIIVGIGIGMLAGYATQNILGLLVGIIPAWIVYSVLKEN
jgi:hypothetical protein